MHKCFVFQNSLTLLLEGEATCSVLQNQWNSLECKAKHDWIIMWLCKSLNLQKNASKYAIENLHEGVTAYSTK